MDRKTMLKVESWCHANNIKIYASPISNTEVVIIIENKDKPPRAGDKRYKTKPSAKDEKWWDVVRVLQLHYFNHYNHHNP